MFIEIVNICVVEVVAPIPWLVILITSLLFTVVVIAVIAGM